MRVAAIYDIHANLPALEAVLWDIRQAEVDLIRANQKNRVSQAAEFAAHYVIQPPSAEKMLEAFGNAELK